ncbi:MAG: hypothetical protein IPM66_08055 [Acidobacteriota bacterium]|nr:MAG: hypothetical protein IPM66_08055 [Acidobacteriota bacterium]
MFFGIVAGTVRDVISSAFDPTITGTSLCLPCAKMLRKPVRIDLNNVDECVGGSDQLNSSDPGGRMNSISASTAVSNDACV